MLFAAVLMVGLLLITGLLFVLSNNGVVGKDQAVNEKLSEIKNRYRTKLDILPALLAQVDSYKVYEAGLLTNITLLRTHWMSQSNTSASVQALANTSASLDQNLTQIVLTWENYPELEADALVAQYMGEVVDQNEQLSYARAQYNGAVRDFNSFIKSFPNNVFVSGYQSKPYWGTEFPEDALNI